MRVVVTHGMWGHSPAPPSLTLACARPTTASPWPPSTFFFAIIPNTSGGTSARLGLDSETPWLWGLPVAPPSKEGQGVTHNRSNQEPKICPMQQKTIQVEKYSMYNWQLFPPLNCCFVVMVDVIITFFWSMSSFPPKLWRFDLPFQLLWDPVKSCHTFRTRLTFLTLAHPAILWSWSHECDLFLGSAIYKAWLQICKKPISKHVVEMTKQIYLNSTDWLLL